LKLQNLSLTAYDASLSFGGTRSGFFLHLTDDAGKVSSGEMAPLPTRSPETLADALQQFYRKRKEILAIDWTIDSCFSQIETLQLLPSLSFALESALLALLSPLPPFSVPVSALLMGSLEDILIQADARQKEGYQSAKLKVGNLSFEQAKQVIDSLKDTFSLRIDVNRAWKTHESLQFFSQYAVDAFEYVEEPFQNVSDLPLFTHPLAIDESFPMEISIEALETLPTLKALPIHAWAKKQGISLILSSSFETELGLFHIASMANRLSLSAHMGLGTIEYTPSASKASIRQALFLHR